ncbi:hypothetical protein PTTG_06954 [Puccinia triticina 1-1 BBBD Race 1]|uniref:Calcipressin n=1 Tax=Puccinia triticina (isolate 1-1 / race 1 (BBBD)) TaxID=630390 RepID=A0A0C4F1I3_PUCT1|nr:hypothetical protein PTTG_06954 [Puccinia triticina 1-1 BBBD Race 1]
MIASTIHSAKSLLPLQNANNPRVIPSNSIIITSLPRIFFHPTLQLALRSHFDSYAHILAWTPLPNLARILVVYSDSQPAVAARAEMDHFVFEESEIKELFLSLLEPNEARDHPASELFGELRRTVIRVYFGPKGFTSNCKPTAAIEVTESLPNAEPAGSEASNRLKPPSLEKNFLISPPGSPPVGWTQITEDAPNQKDLADDLCQRLRFLSVGDEDDQQTESQDEQRKSTSEPDPLGSQQPNALNEIVILPAQPARQLPALKVQQIQASKPSPGMGIQLVKATIESMLASATNKIAPTPRPEIF